MTPEELEKRRAWLNAEVTAAASKITQLVIELTKARENFRYWQDKLKELDSDADR